MMSTSEGITHELARGELKIEEPWLVRRSSRCGARMSPPLVDWLVVLFGVRTPWDFAHKVYYKSKRAVIGLAGRVARALGFLLPTPSSRSTLRIGPWS